MNTNALTRAYLVLGGLGAVSLIGYGVYRSYAPVVTASAPATVAQPAPANTKMFGIMTAARFIARGQVITREDVSTTMVAGTMPQGGRTAIGDVVGKVATADILPQQLLLDSTMSADPAKAGLAALVPAGYRAISILTNDEIAVSQFVRPGDKVDIQLVLPDTVFAKQGVAERPETDISEARTVLQDVLVLTVGATLGDPTLAQAAAEQAASTSGRRNDPSRTISLAMTPEQIAKFALARSLGTFYLSLRGPDDLQLIGDNTANLSDIRGPTPPPAAPATPQKRPIELIVGDRTQLIYPKTSGEPR
ncbi:Flp pilus assembly protein CpaB [Inquilinus limosus]|uniref:Flp pilus assembly protein CpaB n=1 Tax=Inquilinus limosus TaxID=171674 RepID=A0A211YTZ6_9PROT|nr:Flp pilus assembly protein CpaB [Inquilinus limosus]OWJ56525.1 Flp pilus assembly protein CpaB [Inquilinus limosus]